MKLLSLLLGALLALTASAAPYIVTSYVVLSVYTYDGYTLSDETYSYTTYLGTTEAESLVTYTRPVAAPTASVSALTTITTDASYADVTIVNVVLESGTSISRTYTTYDSAALETSYVVPITYTPDATCSQNWTYTTNVPIYVPAIVTPSVVSLTTSATTYTYAHLNPTPQTAVMAILNPTEVAADELASASSEYLPYYASYCYTPSTYCPTATGAQCTTTFAYDSSSSSSRSSSYGYYSRNSWLVPLILIAVLVPVGWILLWLLIGLLESWMSFKGLMLGQHRKRGLPYAWCCISVLFLCWVGPTYKAKSPEEQAIMLERWKEMKKREKFKLWMKWGFRWKYPDVLGAEPEVAKRAFRQGCL